MEHIHKSITRVYSTVTKWTAFYKDGEDLLYTHNSEICVAWGKGETISSRSYVENRLILVKTAMERTRSKTVAKIMKILHENARPHVTKEVKLFLSEAEISIIRHPPYSPD